MPTRQEEFDATFGPGGELDTITNDIAADYAAFVKEAQEGTVSAQSIADAKANIETLKALGASKDNPVPPPVDPVDPNV